MSTTTDLSKFGYREISMLRDIINAWMDKGLPEDFDDDGVKAMLNMESGYVFLTNSEFQVAMLNDDKLESFYSTPYEGYEGFYSELMESYDEMHSEDKEYMHSLKEYHIKT